MEKERRQSKDEKTVPLEYRILIIIWMIGLVLAAYLAHSSGIKQNNPWPFLNTLAVGMFVGAIIIIAGIIAGRQKP